MSLVESEDDLPMPQPLKTLLRGTTTFSYIEQLPTQHPQLCALAMAVIAEWSALDGALLGLLTTMFPGRAEPIAEYYTTLRSDGPKTAMLHALAVSFQEVVHSALTGNSEVAKPPAIRGEPNGHP